MCAPAGGESSTLVFPCAPSPAARFSLSTRRNALSMNASAVAPVFRADSKRYLICRVPLGIDKRPPSRFHRSVVVNRLMIEGVPIRALAALRKEITSRPVSAGISAADLKRPPASATRSCESICAAEYVPVKSMVCSANPVVTAPALKYVLPAQAPPLPAMLAPMFVFQPERVVSNEGLTNRFVVERDTALSERISPASLVGLLNRCPASCATIR